MSSGSQPIIPQVRILGLLALPGIWQTASLLHGSLLRTALVTLGAAGLGVWALEVLREEL